MLRKRKPHSGKPAQELYSRFMAYDNVCKYLVELFPEQFARRGSVAEQ
ncbi:MAG: hypothetical protein Q6M04_14615 [Thermostichus sp. BF3_bins_97]